MAGNINDPIVFYVVVRESLGMSPGKIAAQVGHATQHLLMHYFKAQVLKAKIHDDRCFPQVEIDHIQITTEWMSNASTKVILRADDREWEKVKLDYNKQLFLIKDAGFTEIPANSETAIGLYPMRKSQRQSSISRLRLL